MKKTALIGLFVGLVAILVVGGVYRTLDRTGYVAEARGLGQGAGGNGQGGNGYAAGEGSVSTENWRTVEGTVVSVDSSAMRVEIADGEEVTVEGQPYRFVRSLGFAARLGERVRITGFDEAGEFKAGRITHLGTGETFTLRNEAGQPMWSGRGRGGGNAAP